MQLSALNNAGFCGGKINHEGTEKSIFMVPAGTKICVFVVKSDFDLIAQGTDVKINEKILQPLE